MTRPIPSIRTELLRIVSDAVAHLDSASYTLTERYTDDQKLELDLTPSNTDAAPVRIEYFDGEELIWMKLGRGTVLELPVTGGWGSLGPKWQENVRGLLHAAVEGDIVVELELSGQSGGVVRSRSTITAPDGLVINPSYSAPDLDPSSVRRSTVRYAPYAQPAEG